MMSIRSLPILATLLFSAAAAQGQSFDIGNLRIEHPYARPTVAQQPAAGAYLSIENRGKTADSLVSASSPVAKEVQIHTMTMDGDVMRMRELPKLEVKPATTVKMSPGKGYHLMLIGLKQPLKDGQQFPMQLKFETAGQVEVTVTVQERKAGDAKPAMSHGKH